MKKIKILLLLVTLLSVTFYSCTDNNPIENEVVATKSIALRTTLNELKINNNIAGKNAADQAFCFGFIYPINLSYNNGTVISVSSFNGLLELLVNENPNLYIEGIEFPFQVQQEGAITTINNEDEFYTLLEGCNFDTIDDDLATTFCFDIVFPITVTNENNENVEITSIEAFLTYLETPVSGNQTQIVFPISVLFGSQTVIINDLYEFYEMLNNCDDNDCVCTQEYAPVCVNTPAGTIEFGNFCYAQCAGFTQNDLVTCNPSTDCGISNLSVTVGNCNPDYTYALTINFNHSNSPSDQFVVYNSAGTIVGTYLLANLPITIPNYVQYTNATDFLVVDLGVNNNCSATQQWTLPNCGCVCEEIFNPVCVSNPAGGIIQYSNACFAECDGYTQNDFVNCGIVPMDFSTLLGACFTIQYPVTVQSAGAIVTVNSNSQLLQYYNPAQGSVPPMTYPISVLFANDTVYTTVNSQAEFQALITSHCN